MSPAEPSRFRLHGRVAFVTGSSRGLGRAMALSLGAAGARVALNWCNDETSAKRTFDEFRAAGCEGILLRGDATRESDVAAMTAEIAERLGPVDVAVANATPDQPHRPIEEYDWAFYQSMLDFFVKSPFLITRAVLPHMKAQRWGRIVNLGSETFQLGQPDFTAYVAAKGGQNGFTRSLARELAPWNITVNMVSPGWIPTERHANDPPELKDAYLRSLPAGRWGRAEEVADTVTFLASDAASYVSGQNICVNGANTVAGGAVGFPRRHRLSSSPTLSGARAARPGRGGSPRHPAPGHLAHERPGRRVHGARAHLPGRGCRPPLPRSSRRRWAPMRSPPRSRCSRRSRRGVPQSSMRSPRRHPTSTCWASSWATRTRRVPSPSTAVRRQCSPPRARTPPNGHPGARLRHAWLAEGAARPSSLDCVASDAFTLFSFGEHERRGAAAAGAAPVPVRQIRVGEDVSDPDGGWAGLCGVGAEGAVLVRPDQHVAWRASSAPHDPTGSLGSALATVLGC